MEYDEPPRGRVVHDTGTSKFHLYADACIRRDWKMIEQIKTELRLPEKTTIGPDDHYRCERCLRR